MTLFTCFHSIAASDLYHSYVSYENIVVTMVIDSALSLEPASKPEIKYFRKPGIRSERADGVLIKKEMGCLVLLLALMAQTLPYLQ